MTNDPKPPLLLPIWLSLTIIMVSLGAGGSMVHWYMTTDPLSHESTIFTSQAMQAPDVRPGTAGQPRPVRNSPVTVTDNHNGSWTLHTRQANADLLVANDAATLRYAVFNDYSFASKEARNTLNGLRIILGDNNRIAHLELTQQQVGQLRPLNRKLPLELSEQEKEALCKLFLGYVHASEPERSALEATLGEILDQLAQRSTAAARQAAERRAAQVNSIITPEQWKLNSAIGNGK